MFVLRRLSLLSALLLAPCALAAAPKNAPPPPSPPPLLDQTPKPEGRGAFRDAAGTIHHWQVLPSHTLSWDGQPFLPVGVRWTPQTWKPNAVPADAEADRATLLALKQHGVLDVTLSAGSTNLLRVPVSAVQATLDILDANGFRYGMEIAAFPRDPLVGYVVKPGAYRNPAPPTVGPARFGPILGLTDAFYLLVSSHDGQIDESGTAQIEDETTALVTVRNASPDDVLLLYPQRLLTSDAPEGRLPDVWQNFDPYRDNLLSFLRRVKFGPGLRFFLDPLGPAMAFGGETDNILPTTDGWRLDFAAWLDNKYKHNIDDLNTGWGMADRDLPDFAVAARCLPLWYGARGVAAVLDPVTKKRYAVLNKPRIGGHLWEDLGQFRTESVRGYMNAISDALKKGAADVPVVFRWTARSPLFMNDKATGGFDGLWVESTAVGQPPTQTDSALAFAQTEDAVRAQWLVTGGAALPASAPSSLLAAWDGARQTGARGFFASAVPAPNGLDALSTYGISLRQSASVLANDTLSVLPYPDSAGLDITPQRLPSGEWWLPSARAGSSVVVGPSLSAYYLPDPEGRLPTYVVWSPLATLKTAQFPFGKKSLALVTDVHGNPLAVAKKGDVWQVPVGEEPVLVSHVRALPLPLDAADAVVAEAKRLLSLAEAQHVNVQASRDQLFYAINTIPDADSNVDLRYNLVQRVLASLSDILRPYSWMEGESASSYTFDSLTPDPAASAGAYLSLDTTLLPPRTANAAEEAGYTATYRVSVNAPGRYALWLAGTPLDGQSASPFTFRIDDGVARAIISAPSEGGLYAGKFVWSNLGDVTLSRGVHTLILTVTGPRASDKRWRLAVDALCLSRAPFHPNGTIPPRIDLPPPPPDDTQDDKKRRR